MSKARRLLLKIVAVLFGLVLVVLAAALEHVDYRPYLRQPYFTNALAEARAMATSNHAVRAELFAGFGQARLTPHLNAARVDPQQGDFSSLPLAGYGNRHGKPARGVHDDLNVKAVAIRVGDALGIMVGVDALIIPPEVTDLAMDQLQRELHLAREQVYLSATHTHSGLGGWGQGVVAEAFAGGFQPGVRVWLAGQIATAVREAVADLKPASLRQGQFAEPRFVRNRLVGKLGKIDPIFSYLVFKQDQGRVAVLGSYAAHATVLSSDQMEFSADYPGYWQRAVEKATGGMAVFLAGSVGSHSPAPPDKGFAGASKMGEELAQDLLVHLSSLEPTNSVPFGIIGLNLSLPPTNVRLTDNLRLRPWLTRLIVPVRPTTFLQGFRIQNQVWLSTPCDFSGELALGIQDELEHRGFEAAVTSFNGDYIGYVIPVKYYHLDGYEPRTMSFFGPNVPDLFDDLLRQLAQDLTK